MVEYLERNLDPMAEFMGLWPEIHCSTVSTDSLTYPLREDFIICAKATGKPLTRYQTLSGGMRFLFVDQTDKQLVTCQECLEWMHA